jgi:hypothetical protein
MKEIFFMQNPPFPCPYPPDLLLDGYAGRIAREHSGGHWEFSPVNIIPPYFSILIFHLENEQ